MVFAATASDYKNRAPKRHAARRWGLVSHPVLGHIGVPYADFLALEGPHGNLMTTHHEIQPVATYENKDPQRQANGGTDTQQ